MGRDFLARLVRLGQGGYARLATIVGVDLFRRRDDGIDARAFVELAHEAIVSVDGAGVIVGFNPAAEDTFGYDRDEVLGKPLDLLLPEQARTAHHRQMAAFAKGGESSRPMGERRSIAGRRRSGEVFPCEASIVRQDTRRGVVMTAILRDVTERVKAEAKAREAALTIALNNRSKSEFLAAMSHELRTPLNAVIGFSDLMLMDVEDGGLDARYTQSLQEIRKAGERLLTVVGDILDVSDFDMGAPVLKPESLAPAAVLDSVALLYQRRAEEAGVALRVTAADGLAPVWADRGRLKQALGALVANGIGFSRPGGTVVMGAAAAADGGIVFSVADDGIGMTAEQSAAALTVFSQADQSLTRRHEGLGLGLPLAQRIARAHGAALSLDSVWGQGTTVRLTFGVAGTGL